MIDPSNFLSYSIWLSLPMDTRWKIANLFDIKPRGVKETIMLHSGGQVISDGFVHADLAIITKEKMKEITGVESDDFYTQFQALVDKVEGKTNNTNDVQQEEQTKDNVGAEKKIGRPRKVRQA